MNFLEQREYDQILHQLGVQRGLTQTDLNEGTGPLYFTPPAVPWIRNDEEGAVAPDRPSAYSLNAPGNGNARPTSEGSMSASWWFCIRNAPKLYGKFIIYNGATKLLLVFYSKQLYLSSHRPSYGSRR